ncbi:MAG: ABC transporter substrate-binding protein, partial [Thaumarchaeota archaeon]|nr:ABC transporter substrate-binding protein [Nitrososphaerota archaeon]
MSETGGIQRVIIAIIVIIVVVIGAAALVLSRGITSSTSTNSSQSTSNAISTSSSFTSSSPASTSNSSSSSSLSTSFSSTSSSTTSNQVTSSSTLSTSSAANQNQTLTVEDSAWPNVGVSTINPGGNYPVWTEGSVYQTLVNFNLNAEQRQGIFQIVPDLATNWTVSANAETYTFHLRQGVTFSNGDPFNAYVVWTNFYLYYYELGNSTTFWSYIPLFNFSSVVFGSSTLNLINQSGLASPSPQLVSMMSNSNWPVYVNGSSTIVFRLMGPYAFFLNSFSDFSMQTDPMFLLAHGGPGTVTSPNTLFQTLALPGTGPYEVTNVVTNAYIQYQKNPNYWGKNLSSAEVAANPIIDPGHFNSVIVHYTPDGTSRYIDLLNGASQISVVSGSNLQGAEKNPQL